MMTPLSWEEGGGDQERVSVREVVDDRMFCGGPLGTKRKIDVKENIYFNHHLVG